MSACVCVSACVKKREKARAHFDKIERTNKRARSLKEVQSDFPARSGNQRMSVRCPFPEPGDEEKENQS